MKGSCQLGTNGKYIVMGKRGGQKQVSAKVGPGPAIKVSRPGLDHFLGPDLNPGLDPGPGPGNDPAPD